MWEVFCVVLCGKGLFVIYIIVPSEKCAYSMEKKKKKPWRNVNWIETICIVLIFAFDAILLVFDEWHIWRLKLLDPSNRLFRKLNFPFVTFYQIQQSINLNKRQFSYFYFYLELLFTNFKLRFECKWCAATSWPNYTYTLGKKKKWKEKTNTNHINLPRGQWKPWLLNQYPIELRQHLWPVCFFSRHDQWQCFVSFLDFL